MCGLVGIVIKANNGGTSMEADAFKDMLFIDTLRGEDSTGVVLWDKEGECKVIKDVTAAPEFIKSKEFQGYRTAFINRGKAFLGHNRKKTVGKVEKESAHPFVYDDRYVFMHNGTLTNDTKLGEELGENLSEFGVNEFSVPKTKVDSEILGQMLVPFGENKEALEKMLGKVSGAYACVWLDQVKETLYLLRNKERPLFIAHSAVGILYASEPSFIYAAASRNRIKIDDLEEVKEDTLYKIDISDTYTKTCTIKEEGLTIKKSLPLVTSGQGLANSTTKSGKGEGVSKTAFRRFRKDFLGKTICFWVDDYVERNYPEPSDGEWILFGESVALDEKHVIYGYLSGVDEETLKSYYVGHLAIGKIESITYEPKTKTLGIHLGYCKLQLTSNSLKGKPTHGNEKESMPALH